MQAPLALELFAVDVATDVAFCRERPPWRSA